MKRFKNGESYEIEIKLQRNAAFHGKVFAFFNFCFDCWASDREFMDEAGQFDVFRKNLTVLAGYYDQYYTISGEMRVEAKSLSYASMEQEEFEQCYSALINAALVHIFPGCDAGVESKLYDFF
jgi:hypothetical protein